MATDKYPTEVMETDVLVIGGGLAGSMAAIKARERDAGGRKKCLTVARYRIDPS